MRQYLLLLALLLTLPMGAKNDDLETLYREIDDAIEHSSEYVNHYEAEIRKVKDACQKETVYQKRLQLLQQLADMYKGYNNDSAMLYIQQYISQAEQMDNQQAVRSGRIQLAFQCSTVGLYTESIGILNAIDSRTLDRQGQTDYFQACMHVCGELAYYTRLQDMRDYYYRLQDNYRDSLFQVADPNSEEYLLQKESQLRNMGMYDEALKINDRRLAAVSEPSRAFAIVAYYRYLILQMQGRQHDAKMWLARSGLSDVRQAVMDQAALLSLSEQLNAEGDLERSYRYIRFTWDCNNRFNTRMRAWQITPILNVIENNYQEAMQRNTRVLVAGVVVVSLLAVLLAAALFFLRRQNRKLAAARNALHDSNAQLSSVNTQLSALNEQLQQKTNLLSDANQVKEEYIGRFLSLCSQYIDKLDNYRKMVNKKMKNKELDELFRITKSTELKEKEIEELYQNFDSVFLHLFPNFISEFNALLQPDMQVHPKDDNRLPTDVRIFALIRLGIDDSSKIAEFLHYSVNTIYNYRARIKNGALAGREQFERQVKEIGLPN